MKELDYGAFTYLKMAKPWSSLVEKFNRGIHRLKKLKHRAHRLKNLTTRSTTTELSSGKGWTMELMELLPRLTELNLGALRLTNLTTRKKFK